MGITGDYPIVEDWAKGWPEEAVTAIENNIEDYRHIVKFRTAATTATISGPIEESFQLVINYNSAKECFVVWNAAIQNSIHSSNGIELSLGTEGERLLHSIQPDVIMPFYREIGCGGSNCVELVLFIGRNVFPEFCKASKEHIKPNPELIPKGKSCVYAETGGELQYISGVKEV